jgi:hypothetical protein
MTSIQEHGRLGQTLRPVAYLAVTSVPLLPLPSCEIVGFRSSGTWRVSPSQETRGSSLSARPGSRCGTPTSAAGSGLLKKPLTCRRCHKAEVHRADSPEYAYVLRPEQSEDVIGGFDLWRIGPGAVELGYWIHVGFTGVAMPPRARGLKRGWLFPVWSGLRSTPTNPTPSALPSRVGWATGLTGWTKLGRLRLPHTPDGSRSGSWSAPAETGRTNRRCIAMRADLIA